MKTFFHAIIFMACISIPAFMAPIEADAAAAEKTPQQYTTDYR